MLGLPSLSRVADSSIPPSRAGLRECAAIPLTIPGGPYGLVGCADFPARFS